MILTDRFIFVHLGKCAGTALANFFMNQHGGSSINSSHSGCSDIPKDNLYLPVVSGIRNPWDYYVSRYHFDTKDGNQVHRLRGLEDASGSFKSWIMKLLCGDVVSDNVDFGFLRKHDIGNLTSSFIDTCYRKSWTFGSFSQESIGVDYFLPFELLPGCLGSFLKDMRLSSDTSSMRRMNQSSHKDYRYYYDDELIGMVCHYERHIIDYFGYEFDGGSNESLINLRKE